MTKLFTIKNTLFLSIGFFTTLTVLGQQTTRITKTIEMPPWLDLAVADANEIEGAHHIYTNYTTMIASTTIGLKPSRIKAGMLVTLLNGVSGTESLTTLRLRSDFNTGGGTYPTLSDWARVAEDGLIVDTLTARNLLHDTTGTTSTSLEVGTIVLVVDDGTGSTGAYVFIGTGHGIDIDNDGNAGEANSQDDAWFSLGGGGESIGNLYFGNGVSAFTSAPSVADLRDYYNFATNSWITGTPTDTTIAGTSFYNINTVTGTSSTTAGATAPSDSYYVFAFPKAWGVPLFYGKQGAGNLFQLYDLWQRFEIVIGGVTYYAFVTDTYVNPSSGGVSDFNIVIR